MGKYFRIKRSQAGDIHMNKMLVLQKSNERRTKERNPKSGLEVCKRATKEIRKKAQERTRGNWN